MSLLIPIERGPAPIDRKRLRTLLTKGLVDAMHDAPTGRGGRPATVSVLAAPDALVARVTALTPAVSAHVLSRLARERRVGGGNELEQAHRWGVRFLEDPDELVDARRTTRSDSIGVSFLTPTTFRAGDRGRRNRHFEPLPQPGRVVEAWVERMRARFPELVQDLTRGDPGGFVEWARDRVWLNEGYALLAREEEIRLGRDKGLVEVRVLAFTGCVVFSARESEGPRRQLLRTLARFAFYCGTGYGTIHGFGQTLCTFDEGHPRTEREALRRLAAHHRTLERSEIAALTRAR